MVIYLVEGRMVRHTVASGGRGPAARGLGRDRYGITLRSRAAMISSSFHQCLNIPSGLPK